MLNLFLLSIILVLFILIIRSTLNNAKLAKQNSAVQTTFLSENKTREAIIETDSGLQYEVLVSVDEGQSPIKSAKVTCHYHGTLLDGAVFDSSVERNKPLSFSLNQVIPGWIELLQLMKEGEKVKAYIPYQLAYGKRSAGKIPPPTLLIFEIELLAVEN